MFFQLSIHRINVIYWMWNIFEDSKVLYRCTRNNVFLKNTFLLMAAFSIVIITLYKLDLVLLSLRDSKNIVKISKVLCLMVFSKNIDYICQCPNGICPYSTVSWWWTPCQVVLIHLFESLDHILKSSLELSNCISHKPRSIIENA